MKYNYSTAEDVMDYCENSQIPFKATFFNNYVDILVDKKDREKLAGFPEIEV